MASHTYLVTGGAGFIGSHIVEMLLQQGHHVRVLDNLSTGHRSNLAAVADQIEFILGDIRDETVVTQAVQGMDYILHLAAVVSVPASMKYPQKTEIINTLGTLNLLQAAHAAHVKRVVLSSTCAVYGDEPTLPKVEIMLPHPKSPYAISKLAAEQYCRFYHEAYGLETVILRYFNVFGPRQDPTSPYSGVISIFIDKMRQQIAPTIFGDGEQTRDFVYVSDIAQANLLATQSTQAAGQTMNIGRGQPINLNQLAQTLGGLLNFTSPPTYQPARHGDIRHSFANPTLAQDLLGWQPQTSFEMGLQKTINFQI